MEISDVDGVAAATPYRAVAISNCTATGDFVHLRLNHVMLDDHIHHVKRVVGVIVFLMGLALAGWIAYNLLIERLPATKGRSPIPAMITATLFLFVGYRWMKGQQAE